MLILIWVSYAYKFPAIFCICRGCFFGRAVHRNRKAFALLDPYGLRCLLSEKAEMLQNPRKCQKSQGDTIFPNFIIFYRLVGGGDVNAHVSVLIF